MSSEGNFATLTWEQLWAMILPVAKMLLILLAGHFAIKYLVKLFSRAMSSSKLDESLARFTGKSINIALHILIFLSALSTIGVSTSGIVAAISAAAVALSVALKDSLSNVAGGIVLLLSPRFVTGDYISSNGDEGTVLSVDLMHTTLLTLDRRQVTIPNGILVNQHLTNYSREPERRVDLTFPISYESDPEQAKAIAMGAILKHPLILTDREPPFVRIHSYQDSSVNLITRVWCKTENYWTLYYDLTEQIRAEFDKNGIGIPYNQLDVHIKN
ncbi:MAG: mechanosensitive ion channel family protein [Clostridia bacterium]|nr:mechanosensitive ion channel family protein [Clostridia bacterium]